MRLKPASRVLERVDESIEEPCGLSAHSARFLAAAIANPGDQPALAQLVSRSHPRSSWTSRAVITSVCLTPVFRSDIANGPERIADPRRLAVDIVPEHANRCTTQSAKLARAGSQ